MSSPDQEPGTCDGCWYLPPAGRCTGCGVEICPHCRHAVRLELCDGCGCDADSDDRVRAGCQVDPIER